MSKYTFKNLNLEDPCTEELMNVLPLEKGNQLKAFIEKVEDLLEKSEELKVLFRKNLIQSTEDFWYEYGEVWSRKIVEGGEHWDDYHWTLEYYPNTDLFRVCAGDQWIGDKESLNDHTSPESLYGELKELILENI